MSNYIMLIILLGVVMLIMSFMYAIQRWDNKYLRKEIIRREAKHDAERTDLLNRIAARSIGEYERLSSGHMPRDEPNAPTAHDKALSKWRSSGDQGGIAKP